MTLSIYNKANQTYNVIKHMFSFLKALNSWSNDLVVKVKDSQSQGVGFKTARWLQGQLSLSSF